MGSLARYSTTLVPAKRLLVVDDQHTARDVMHALLMRDSYELDFADGGSAALECLERKTFDLVLCDLVMPGTDGLAVCRAMKADPELRFTPIMLVTALDDDDDVVRGIEAGADELIAKPINKQILRAKVRALLRIREHYIQLRNAATDLDAFARQRRDQLVTAARLSSREREVLDLLLLGRSHADVALVLGISARTSKFHQRNVLKKLGAESRADLTRLFV